MPYKVVKLGGAKPFGIKNTATGQIVGRSRTKANAAASVRARYAAIAQKEKHKK